MRGEEEERRRHLLTSVVKMSTDWEMCLVSSRNEKFSFNGARCSWREEKGVFHLGEGLQESRCLPGKWPGRRAAWTKLRLFDGEEKAEPVDMCTHARRSHCCFAECAIILSGLHPELARRIM